MQLSGKVAVLTGAGQGLGLACAHALAEAVPGGVQVAADLTAECDAQAKPVCVARAIFRFYD